MCANIIGVGFCAEAGLSGMRMRPSFTSGPLWVMKFDQPGL